MIIRGGENIYPREIEQVLVQHPDVRNAVVEGLPDEKWGETVAAVAQPQPGGTLPSEKDLHDFVRARLAPHKTPKAWYAVEERPADALGKLQKFRLRDQNRADVLLVSTGEIARACVAAPPPGNGARPMRRLIVMLR